MGSGAVAAPGMESSEESGVSFLAKDDDNEALVAAADVVFFGFFFFLGFGAGCFAGFASRLVFCWVLIFLAIPARMMGAFSLKA